MLALDCMCGCWIDDDEELHSRTRLLSVYIHLGCCNINLGLAIAKTN
jgi:hypothetical protein